MQQLRPLLSGMALALLPLASYATEGIYDIEMVVFEQPPGDDTESFPDAPESPDLTRALATLSNPLDSQRARLAGIELLPIREGQLGPAVYTLNRKGVHVLLHLRWRQTFPEVAEDRWFRIQAEHLDGLIDIKRGRYLHLYTDLLLQTADKAYRVQEHARARSGELHYLDHPKLGILYRADRYEPPAAAQIPAEKQSEPEPAKAAPEQDNPPEQRAPAGELPRAMPDTS